eukprot:3851529-Rhodomonas_salina.1
MRQRGACVWIADSLPAASHAELLASSSSCGTFGQRRCAALSGGVRACGTCAGLSASYDELLQGSAL